MERLRTRSAQHLSESEDATLPASQHAQAGPSRARDPPRGSPRATPSIDGSEDDIEEEVEEVRVQGTPTEPARPTIALNGSEPPTISEELLQMRAWLASAKAQEELRVLRELRARYDAGDITAIGAVSNGQGGTVLPPAISTGALPRPEPPQQFAKRNRAEFNRWERDCEGFFTRSAANFILEQQKVDFGVMYISEPLKTLWRAHCLVEEVAYPGWIPTWMGLKTVMLNSLGTPQERRKLAYEQLRSCRQRVGQTPTELLDYLRPLWEELGSTVTPELQVIEYTSALRSDIQRDLERLPTAMRCTIPMVEEQANIIYRRTPTNHDHSHKNDRKKPNHFRARSDGSGGDANPPKKAKNPRAGQHGPKRDKSGATREKTIPVTCYNCGQAGHYSYNCTNPAKPGSDPRKENAGKGKGRRD
jgi:hypothetical protein